MGNGGKVRPQMSDLIRTRITNYCEWGIQNSPQIHYAQIRPIPAHALAHPHELPITTDCSGFAILAYKWAGAPDPSGNEYNGHGFTGDMMRHGHEVQQPKPGDLIIFGAYPGRHVTIYLPTWHGAWVTCSHGQEIGPIRILNHREELAQGVPFQVRSYLP